MTSCQKKREEQTREDKRSHIADRRNIGKTGIPFQAGKPNRKEWQGVKKYRILSGIHFPGRYNPCDDIGQNHCISIKVSGNKTAGFRGKGEAEKRKHIRRAAPLSRKLFRGKSPV